MTFNTSKLNLINFASNQSLVMSNIYIKNIQFYIASQPNSVTKIICIQISQLSLYSFSIINFTLTTLIGLTPTFYLCQTAQYKVVLISGLEISNINLAIVQPLFYFPMDSKYISIINSKLSNLTFESSIIVKFSLLSSSTLYMNLINLELTNIQTSESLINTY